MLEQRPLVLRSNRFLGAALLERDLVSNADLETANEKLLEVVQAGDLRSASLLNILIFELKALDETKLIDSLMERDEVSLIDLGNYDLGKFREMRVNIDVCWATFTIPFDRVEDFYMVATGYYLSEPAKQYWAEQFDGNILWYVASITSIAEALDRAGRELGELKEAES
ncbi:hypothetical protein H5P28_02510 [Ruficoccus amylovorans]|uniref:Type II secretion system protein GspE N-terminal domain-containing protein n=1 Tax=Ruficoccus amylovorans TaxID=1804625 RepID=A0A842HC38_9BACT|nr:hypothetical protein [Ruficoccus amylovorans]MBC2593124.1 hypothetical protein [Ruficoccus amylovorans]